MYTQDDLFGDALTLFYDTKHGLDSISWNGTPVKLKYDKQNRLKKASFGDWAWFDFKYNSNFPLPVALNFNYPNFGGLVAIDSFKYNWLGQVSARILHNVFHPEYNFIERYTYNDVGNAIKVDIKAHSGGTVFLPGFTEFTASKYDSKLNLIASSPLLRYLFLHSDYDGMPFSIMSSSVNNASSYKWLYDDAGDSYSVKSKFDYNAQGFPNMISMDWYDDANAQDLGIFTRLSFTTCDVNVTALAGPKQASFIQNLKKAARPGLPITTKRKE